MPVLYGLHILSLRRFGAAYVFVSFSMTGAQQAMFHVWRFHVELSSYTCLREGDVLYSELLMYQEKPNNSAMSNNRIFRSTHF